jgi:hypothetical protein
MTSHGGVMKKIGYFLMVGLVFTAFQVGTAVAQVGTMGGNSGMPPMGNDSGMPPMGDTTGMPPMGNHSGMPPMGDTTGMPPMGNHSGMPPMGDNSMMPPMGISGEITYCEEFSDQPKKRGEVNCLRDLLDQTPLSETVRHAKKGKKRGFYKCGSKDRAQHVGCLRDLLRGQNDKPGMAPGTN